VSETTIYESKVDLVPKDMRALQRLTANGGHNPRVFAHRAIWSLFGGDPDARRDFVFTVTSVAPFAAIVRSREPVPDGVRDWNVKSYPLETHFEQGRVLGFRIEAVAEVARSIPGTRRSKRMDIIFDAFDRHRELQEGAANDLDLAFADLGEIAARAAHDWMEAQGKARGFEIVRNDEGNPLFVLVDHQRHRIPHKKGPINAGAITVEGALRVTNPIAFSEALIGGFGRLRAFGFGLMQVRSI
jgi:CRISPR system Cascade subunit CasE